LIKKAKEGDPGDKINIVATLQSDADLQVLEESVKRLGGQLRVHLPKVRQVVLEVPVGQIPYLPGVMGLNYVTPDRSIDALASHLNTTTGASLVQPSDNGTSLVSLLTGMGTYDGGGVAVAVIDSGIEGEQFDLRDGGYRRTVLHVNFAGSGSVNDPYGHGTHVAGLIAGNGYSSKQVGLDYTGIAPKARLVNLRVLDDWGRGTLSGVITAIDWSIANARTYNIKVLNMSIAAPPIDSYRDDPLCQAVERASRAGLVVVAAAGNFGIGPDGQEVYGGITSPGISPAAITVGATDTRGTNVRSDDTVATFSSRGPTRSHSFDPLTGEAVYDNQAKPDLVAPGTKDISLERADSTIIKYVPSLHVYTRSDNKMSRYMMMSGTSMSTGVVSGTVALMLQANPSLTPNMVKAILMYTAQRMNGPDLFEQGAGQLNVAGAVRLAAAMRKDLGSVPAGARTIYTGVLPSTQNNIAGETVVWGQGLIWNFGWLFGTSTMLYQQEAFAQGLIWNGWLGDRLSLGLWGAGVSYRDGLFSDTHVVYGQSGQWSSVVWDQGTQTSNGLWFYDDLAASGVPWRDRVMVDDFYSVDSAGLIWNFYRMDGTGLIWNRYVCDVGLIWNLWSYFGFGGGY
ncbi:MAG TPA: S8 family peptidase, partial [Nocardioides sp.]|nr:S8 family peptidase [Nocardioides sp.]